MACWLVGEMLERLDSSCSSDIVRWVELHQLKRKKHTCKYSIIFETYTLKISLVIDKKYYTTCLYLERFTKFEGDPQTKVSPFGKCCEALRPLKL